ncbi:uncharacterized protein LOC106643999 [Copidosoma floridanum]|uniref:uncharacterized protein LOC106643999 n=1 Tax=Copidosoma floridanum TaxID=29053 RepID=UPI000C6F86C6|nr:uncharacterized protein LOC106643999 [Copidosoma floridanum]
MSKFPMCAHQLKQSKKVVRALLTRVGSNISLPACVPQEQESLASQTESATPGSYQKPILLQLTPVTTTSEPLPSPSTQKEKSLEDTEVSSKASQKSQKQQHSELMSSVSTLYANLLVVVGVAVPVTVSVSQQVPKALDQVFYLYLYMVSVAFVVAMYGTLARDKALKKMIVKHQKKSHNCTIDCKNHLRRQQMAQQRQRHYGSFCLRLGTVGFGAGSLVFTGLHIGAELASEPLRAIVPGTRLLLVTAQMHFIFLNSKDLSFTRHEALAKLGLMHLIATNICEWLKVKRMLK